MLKGWRDERQKVSWGIGIGSVSEGGLSLSASRSSAPTPRSVKTTA